MIDNRDYTREVGQVKNPVNDVKLIAQSLGQIGFADADIRIVKNAGRRVILAEVDQSERPGLPATFP